MTDLTLFKQVPLRSKVYTDGANGLTCIRCGADDGTVRGCHYNGWRSLSYGKGRGEKCGDIMIADFCQRCDQVFSEENYGDWEHGSDSLERSEQFQHWVLKTIERRIRLGMITVHGMTV